MVLSCGIIRWRTLRPANYRARCNMRRWCTRRYILRSPYVPIFDYLQTKLWSRRRAPRCTLVIHMIVYIFDYYGKRSREIREDSRSPQRGSLGEAALGLRLLWLLLIRSSDLHSASSIFFFLFIFVRYRQSFAVSFAEVTRRRISLSRTRADSWIYDVLEDPR